MNDTEDAADREIHHGARVTLRSESGWRFRSFLDFDFVNLEHDVDVIAFRGASEEKRIAKTSRNADWHQEAALLDTSRHQILKAQPYIAS